MRFMTLAEMVDELRAETGVSQNAAHGLASRTPQEQLLRRVQEDLYLAHDWPHMKTERSKDVPEGARYLELPDTFEFSGLDAIYATDAAGKWFPLAYGITPAEYNRYDPDIEADRRFPIERWQTYLQAEDDVSTRMFEIWPVPDQDTMLLLRGRRALLPLDADDKKSSLDGPTIVLFAAAEILARQKAEDAGLKLQKAMDRLRWLKTRAGATDTRRANLAGGTAPRNLRPGLDYMPRR